MNELFLFDLLRAFAQIMFYNWCLFSTWFMKSWQISRFCENKSRTIFVTIYRDNCKICEMCSWRKKCWIDCLIMNFIKSTKFWILWTKHSQITQCQHLFTIKFTALSICWSIASWITIQTWSEDCKMKIKRNSTLIKSSVLTRL